MTLWPIFLAVLGGIVGALELWCLRTGRDTLSMPMRGDREPVRTSRCHGATADRCRPHGPGRRQSCPADVVSLRIDHAAAADPAGADLVDHGHLAAGTYPDGYWPQGGAWFILSDQIWTWLICVTHTLSQARRCMAIRAREPKRR